MTWLAPREKAKHHEWLPSGLYASTHDVKFWRKVQDKCANKASSRGDIILFERSHGNLFERGRSGKRQPPAAPAAVASETVMAPAAPAAAAEAKKAKVEQLVSTPLTAFRQYIGRTVHTAFASEKAGGETVYEGAVTKYDEASETFSVYFAADGTHESYTHSALLADLVPTLAHEGDAGDRIKPLTIGQYEMPCRLYYTGQ